MLLYPSRRWTRLLPAILLVMTGVTGECKPQPWAMWDSYAARFVDGQGRVIDPQGDSRTTSEGQSYALFFALVDNDRPRFDRVLAWTQANLAQGDLSAHLPSWLWGRDKDGAWKTLDPNSAGDSDVWIAYTLCEAGRLWKHPPYSDIGRSMMARIAAAEVRDLPGLGPMLLPGPIGFEHHGAWTLNPSYLPVFLFQRFAAIDPAGPWQKIALNIPRVVEHSSRNGFAMDWVTYSPESGFSPSPQSPDDKTAAPPSGSYDAIRVYLWAGMLDGEGRTRSELLKSLYGMNAYLAVHDAPPERVNGQGIPLGNDGGAGFSAALFPYLAAIPDSAKALSRQVTRVNALKDSTSGLLGKDLRYYDQNLGLFGAGFLHGRYKFGPGGELAVGWTHS
jgi:endoglucanase